MSTDLPPRLLEMICSRICHDLVSPVGAINNGIELIEDIGDEVTEEAHGLIADSARQAAHRLAMFRLAFGAGSSGANMAAVRVILGDYFAGGRITLDWPETSAMHIPQQLLALTVMTGADLVQNSATLRLTDDGPDGVVVAVTGAGSDYISRIADALAGNTSEDKLDPRSAVAYLLGRLAVRKGIDLSFAAIASEQVEFHLRYA
ncbi:MAG: histidine phosphotransferase family protein [Pseudomonadota bacterium]|nr:histidine phosphotransferase family protein [Pseudomonadota bacterium]